MALCDGEELVCELDATGNPVAGVVFGANGLLVYGTAGYQFDPQGNATHLLDDERHGAGAPCLRCVGSAHVRQQPDTIRLQGAVGLLY
jgi:hypothetical protein